MLVNFVRVYSYTRENRDEGTIRKYQTESDVYADRAEVNWRSVRSRTVYKWRISDVCVIHSRLEVRTVVGVSWKLRAARGIKKS